MSLSKKDGYIWRDGELTRWADATTHVLSHGLHYGTSIFEGVRCYQTDNGAAIFRLQDHTNRFFDSAHIIGMKIPFSRDDINAAQCEAVRANNLNAAYIRPLAFYGADSLGLGAADNRVHVVVAAWTWGAYLGEDGLKNGIRVKTSSFARMHVNSNMCLAKVGGHYINSVMAHAEVARNGYDEALMLDTTGMVAEGPGENLFLVRRGKLYTPPLASVLDGITRNTVFTLANDLGYDVVERGITRDALYCADEAFFTGTAAEVTPIREVDDRQIGDGGRGPVTTAVQQAFFDAAHGKHRRSAEWLTFVGA